MTNTNYPVMKKVLCMLCLCFGLTVHAQNAFYDAQVLARLDTAELKQILDLDDLRTKAVELKAKDFQGFETEAPEDIRQSIKNALKAIGIEKTAINKLAPNAENYDLALAWVIADLKNEKHSGNWAKFAECFDDICADWSPNRKNEDPEVDQIIVQWKLDSYTDRINSIKANGFKLSDEERFKLEAIDSFIKTPFGAGSVPDLSILPQVRAKFEDFVRSLSSKDKSNLNTVGVILGYDATTRLSGAGSDGGRLTGSTLSLPGTIASAVAPGAAFQSQLIDALGTFIATRFKEEVTATYLNRFKEWVGKIPEIQTLLPHTWQLFDTEDPFEYVSLGQKWRTAFHEDLKEIPINLRDLIWKSKPGERWNNLKQKTAFHFIDLGVTLGDKMARGLHPSEILQHLEDRFSPVLNKGRNNALDESIFRSVHLLNLLQKNFLDTTKATNGQFDFVWIHFDDLAQLDMPKEREYFSALLYRQDRDLFDELFAKGSIFTDAAGWKEKVSAKKTDSLSADAKQLYHNFEIFLGHTKEFLNLLREVENQIKAFKTALNAGEKAPELFEKYSRAFFDLLRDFDKMYSDISGKGSLINPKVFTYTDIALDIYGSIVRKDFHEVISGITRLIRELFKPDEDGTRLQKAAFYAVAVLESSSEFETLAKEFKSNPAQLREVLRNVGLLALEPGLTKESLEGKLKKLDPEMGFRYNDLNPDFRQILLNLSWKGYTRLQSEMERYPGVTEVSAVLTFVLEEGSIQEAVDALKGEGLAFVNSLKSKALGWVTAPVFPAKEVGAWVKGQLQILGTAGAALAEKVEKALGRIHDKVASILNNRPSLAAAIHWGTELYENFDGIDDLLKGQEKLMSQLKNQLPGILLSPDLDPAALKKRLEGIFVGDDLQKVRNLLMAAIENTHTKVWHILNRFPSLAQTADLVASFLESNQNLAQVLNSVGNEAVTFKKYLLSKLPLQLLYPEFDSVGVSQLLGDFKIADKAVLKEWQISAIEQAFSGLHSKVQSIIRNGGDRLEFAALMTRQFLEGKKSLRTILRSYESRGKEVVGQLVGVLTQTLTGTDQAWKVVSGKLNTNLLALKGPDGSSPLLSEEEAKTIVSNTEDLYTYIQNYLSGDAVVNTFNQKVLMDLIKYGSFMVEIVNAKNADEMKAAIEQVVLPPGSYIIKRKSLFSVTISAHPGLLFGAENGLGGQTDANPSVSARNWDFNAGVTAPIGLEFSWGFRTRNRNKAGVKPIPVSISHSFKNEKAKKNHKLKRDETEKCKERYLRGDSWGVFIGVLDLGAVVSARLSGDTLGLPTDLKLVQVFSPSVYLTYGFKNAPISLGAGIQYMPQLRKIIRLDDEGNDLGDGSFATNSLFLGARITWDMPLLSIYQKKYKFKGGSKGSRKIKKLF